MNEANLTVRLLDEVARGSEGSSTRTEEAEPALDQNPPDAAGPADQPGSVSSAGLLRALIAADYDLHRAVVQVARGD